MRIEPVGPTLADHIAPGGKWSGIGESLRYYDGEIERLRSAGFSLAVTQDLVAARERLWQTLLTADAAEPRVWRVIPDRPEDRTVLERLQAIPEVS